MNVQSKEDLKTILKFDVGADGFKKMIWVLAFAAFGLLLAGGVFIIQFFNEMSGL